MAKFALAGALVVLASSSSGCVVETHDHAEPAYVVPSQGTLIVDWTIDGYKDPAKCSQSASSAIEITVYAQNGANLGSFQQDCGAFATSIALDPGSYTADAVLLDSSGYARTTTLNLDAFRILGDDQLSTPIDFPADSFL